MEEDNQKRGYSSEDFKRWILEQTSSEYTIRQEDDRHFRLENEYGVAEINFYPQDIVEISITCSKNGDNRFWLHFQLNDEEHAKQLFQEMTEAFLSLKENHKIRVLLSCSSGFTTSFFAEKLNETARNLELDYEFHAVSYYSIYEEAKNYDMVLIAPQIGYMLKKLKEAVPDKPVAQLPTALFASYDAMKALEFVRDQMKSFLENKKTQQKPECACCTMKQKAAILTIAFRIEESAETRIYYRLYKNGEIVLDDMVRKTNLNYSDLGDIIDTVTAQYPQIDLIGIASPGIITNQNSVSFESRSLRRSDEKSGFPLCHLGDWIHSRYGIPTIVSNNTNAAALGFSKAHPEYDNLVYHSQPYGLPGGGQGYIIDRKLHRGKNGVSGEFKFFAPRMQYSDDLQSLAKTDQGMLEIVTKALLPVITMLGPDAAAIRSPMTSDMNEIRSKLKSFVPEEYLPEFIYVPDDRDYLLTGQLHICLEKLAREKEEKHESTAA